jgi:hypothetical protein
VSARVALVFYAPRAFAGSIFVWFLGLLAGKFIAGRYICEWRRPVKMIAEYLEHALQFELLASAEMNPKLKADLQNQATAYRNLAAERTKQLREAEAALLRRL